MPTLHWIGKEKVINHHTDVPFKVLDKIYDFGMTIDESGKPVQRYTIDDIRYKIDDLNENLQLKNDDLRLKEIPNRKSQIINQKSEIVNRSSGNKIIHGDNLEALKALLPEYEGRIKCIYIDPPYNTGNESWVYNDNVNDPKIKRWLGQVVGKEAEDLTRHDKWLCMMYPRLKLLHKLLADDGAIFISIDDNEQANLKLICDEVFGGGNFIRNIIWHKKYAASNDAKGIPDVHDFIICYQKTNQFQRNLLPRTDKQNSLYKFDSNDGMGLWRPDNLTVKSYSKDYDYPIINPKTGIEYHPTNGRCWNSNETQILKWIKDGRIFFGQNGTGAPQLKRYLNEVQNGIVPISYWSYDEVNHTDGAKKELKSIFSGDKAPFQTPKPSKLLERVLLLATDINSIVLDSYAGSGTTAHAVLNLNKKDGGNRKFILIEMEEYAETITAERVKRVMNGYNSTEGTGGSFDFYELGQALFNEAGNLNESVGIEKIRQYVWYTETKQSLNFDSSDLYDLSDLRNGNQNNQINHKNHGSDSFLGKHNDTAYYFNYEKDEVTTLDHAFLASMKTKAEQYVIYADNCLLTKDFMMKHHIIFKKIPRDITRF